MGAKERNCLRDRCVDCFMLLQGRHRITLDELAEELNVSKDTAQRWVNSFSLRMDLRIERGVVIVGDAAASRPTP